MARSETGMTAMPADESFTAYLNRSLQCSGPWCSELARRSRLAISSVSRLAHLPCHPLDPQLGDRGDTCQPSHQNVQHKPTWRRLFFGADVFTAHAIPAMGFREKTNGFAGRPSGWRVTVARRAQQRRCETPVEDLWSGLVVDRAIGEFGCQVDWYYCRTALSLFGSSHRSALVGTAKACTRGGDSRS